MAKMPEILDKLGLTQYNKPCKSGFSKTEPKPIEKIRGVKMKAVISFDVGYIKKLNRHMYSGHPVVIAVRELLQNAIDATLHTPLKVITIIVNDSNPTFSVMVTDSGNGMDESDINGKFLRMPSSSKTDDNGSVGGFGIGVKSVVLSADYWQLWTNGLYVDSDIVFKTLGDIESKKCTGTQVFARYEEKTYNDVLLEVVKLVYTSDIDVRLVLEKNGESIFSDNHAGCINRKKQLLGFGDEFTISGMRKFSKGDYEISSFTAFRVNGLTQYTESAYASERTGIFVIDIQSDYSKYDSRYPFSASRESVKYGLNNAIRTVIKGLDRDTRSTSEKIEGEGSNEIILEGGKRLLRGMRGYVPALRKNAKKGTGTGTGTSENGGNGGNGGNSSEFFINARDGEFTDEQLSNIPYSQRDANENSESVLRYNYPSGDILQKYQKMLKAWGIILSIVADKNEIFGIGLVGEKTAIAMRTKYHGQTFYLFNPQKVDKLKDWNSRFIYLYHLAIHECAHKEYQYHDEDFSKEMELITFDTAEGFYNVLKSLRSLVQ